ncbi:MAG: A24 family peptidase [Bacillota bacterium]
MDEVMVGMTLAAAMAAVAARTDIETGKIYNVHTIAGLLFGCLLGYLQGNFLYTIYSALVTGLIPFIFWLAGKIGGGDFKISLALGALVGAEVGVFAFLFAWIIVFFVYLVKHYIQGSSRWFLVQNILVALSFLKISQKDRRSGEEVCFGLYLFFGLFIAEIVKMW